MKMSDSSSKKKSASKCFAFVVSRMPRLFLYPLLVFLLSLSVSAEVAERPNALFIVSDDLNDWVGFMEGSRNAFTPNLDRLASQGVAFLDAHASSPLCGPSRAAFMSGMSAATSGFHDNDGKFSENELLTGRENLPQFFKGLGYRTMGAGKIFHYGYPEYWHEYLERGPRMYQAGDPKRNGFKIPGIMDWGPIELTEEEMDDYRMAQFAIDRLGREYDRPFFLACGIYLPHAPWYAPEEFFEPFPVDEILLPVENPEDHDDLPVRGRQMIRNSYQEIVEALGEEAHRDAVRSYLAAIHFADAQIGRILDALEESPHADNTIVVVFGDHGSHLGEKQRWHKDTLWVESTRTPLIIRAPGREGNGEASRRMASLLDLYPTLAELVGGEPPAHLEGRSLVSLLDDPDRSWPYAVVTHRRPGQVAVRTEDWCYIRYEDGGEEFYDRKADPGEWVNLAEISQYEVKKEEVSSWIESERRK